jgi:DNA transformation protein
MPKAYAKRQPPPILGRSLALFGPLGPVAPRRMFGGWGLFLDGVMIALIARDRLYLKVDSETMGRFAAAGSEAFAYRGKTRPVALSYWSAPAAALDDPEAFLDWGELAVAAARRASISRKRESRRGKSAAY